MAGDWVAVRVMLEADPKTLAMAEALNASPAFLLWLAQQLGLSADIPRTSAGRASVVVPLVMRALIKFWGIARTRGRREGDDVVLDYLDVSGVDGLAGMPSFGLALALVGWAEPLQPHGLRLHNFFEINPDAEDLQRYREARRKRRERERKKQPTSHSQNGQRADNGRTTGGQRADARPPKVTPTGQDLINTPLTPQGGNGSHLSPGEEIPPDATDAFRAAWGRWEEYRVRIGRPLRPGNRARLLARCRALGWARAARSLDLTIAQGKVGLVEAPEGETERERGERMRREAQERRRKY